MKVELDLSNNATKADLKGETGVDAFNLATKCNLASLKAEVDKIDIHKLITVPAYLSQLSNVRDNVVFKNCVYHKLVTKVNTIDNIWFVLKIQCSTDKSGLGEKYLILVGLLTKQWRVVRLTNNEIEVKIPRITGLATTATLNAVKNKMPRAY